MKCSVTNTLKLKGNRFEISINDKRYPTLLREINDPPEVLYVIGSDQINRDCFSIVGARKATPYGINNAHHFGRLSVMHGLTVVSGGAYGCDSAAHKGALEGNGKTIVVLGGGCDCVYPKKHFSLFQEIINQGGSVISEVPWDYPAKPERFLLRNRIIAGMSACTLIVEASFPSGTFSTADAALNSGREIMVVPGSINSNFSLGCNKLLYQGATPIIDDESFADQLFIHYGCLKIQEYRSTNNVSYQTELSEKDQRTYERFLEILRSEAYSVEDIVQISNSPTLNNCGKEKAFTFLRIGKMSQEIERYPDGRWAFSTPK